LISSGSVWASIDRGARGAWCDFYYLQSVSRETRRYVAIKLLSRTSSTSPVSRSLLSGSARRCLDHPNILPVYDFDHVSETLVVMVRQLAAPRDAARSICLPLKLSRKWLALGYAHRQGVVHRDVNPATFSLRITTGRSSPISARQDAEGICASRAPAQA
jgi:serine/threonine protein kinase